jgi:carbon storage regulator
MLVITRKNGEQLIIGRDVEVTVLKVQGKRVKLGIQGPVDVPIHRKELQLRIIQSSQDKSCGQMSDSVATHGGRITCDGETADRELERRIRNFLEALHLPALSDLEVEVQNGTAVITGRVQSFYQKQLATSCCQRVAGVSRVLNEIQVTDLCQTPLRG